MSVKSRLNRLRYFCGDAWEEWRHSVSVNLLALLTLASALFLAGLVMLIVSNIGGRVESLRDDVKIEIYLHDGHGDDDRRELLRRLRTQDGVERVEYVDKDEALRRYRDWAADLAELINDLDANPLPASLEVFLERGSGAGATAAAVTGNLEGHRAVEEVRFNRDWLERLEGVLSLARVGGIVIVALVFLAVVFVMGSVLRLAVFARRDEIEIMQLVGATAGFIRGPYLVAGAVQGLVAALLALVAVEVARSTAVASVEPSLVALVDLVAARPLSLALTGLLMLLGLGVSLAGSYVSVRQSV